MAGVRLKRLRIDRYRNVVPGTDLHFSDGFNVLLGKNGTGKTTLLDLIARVVMGDFSSLKDRSFALQYELSFPGASVDVSIVNHPDAEDADAASFSGFSVPESGVAEWSYRVGIKFDDLDDPYVFDARSQESFLHAGRHGSLPIKLANPYGGSLLFSTIGMFRFLKAEDGVLRDIKNHGATILDVLRFISLASENCVRFDEALDTFTSLTGEGPRVQSPKYKNGGVEVKERMRFRFIPMQMRQVLEGWIEASGADQALAIKHTQLDFLEHAVKVLGFRGANVYLRLLKKDPTNWGERLLFGDVSFDFVLEDGMTIEHQFLSYGQMRLLAFLYYAACNPDIVIADELVNGLHYEWIEACLKEIQNRQSFLTSQNPILLDMLPFESEDEVKESFILCSLEQRDGHGQMVWKNMTDEGANAFFRAYETQALQVSEILRGNDLW